MAQLASELNVDLLGHDDDLDEVIFPVRTMDWHGGSPNEGQLVDVLYENTFTTSRSMRQALINTLWTPDYVQLVEMYVKHKCSDGTVYEIKWRPHTQEIKFLLPPNGTCYTLVSAFLLREQERHDADELGEDGGVDEAKTDDDDDDVQTDLEPINVDAVLAAPAAAPDLSCDLSAAPAADPGDSDSADDEFTLDRFARARGAFEQMYKDHNEETASNDPVTYFA